MCYLVRLSNLGGSGLHRRILEQNKRLGVRFIPGLRARFDHEGGGYLVRVNQAGFRSEHEFESSKSDGSFRVLLFGDSASAGQGVSNTSRYSDVLERMIPGLEVYNFAINGSAPDQQYLVYEEIASQYECDLVVISVWIENIRRVPARYRLWRQQRGLGDRELLVPKAYFTFSGGELQRGHDPVPMPFTPDLLPEAEARYVDWARMTSPKWRKAARRLGLGRMIDQIVPIRPFPEYETPNDPAWVLMKAILLRWFSKLTVPAVLCLLPPPEFVEGGASPKSYQDRFEELAAPGRVIIHDVLDDYLKQPPAVRRSLRFPVDIHPNAEGHKLIAESLAPVIRSVMEVG